MAVLLAEDLLLLLLDDETGLLPGGFAFTEAWTGSPFPLLDVVLGGAVLAELALNDAVTLRESSAADGYFSRVVLTPQAFEPGGPAADDLLRAALERVDEQALRPVDLVVVLSRGLGDAVTARLVDRGVLRREDRRRIGRQPRTHWRQDDRAYEDDVQRRLVAAVVGWVPPDARTSTLVALLASLNIVHAAVTRTGADRAVVRHRTAQIAAGCWPAAAVQEVMARLGAGAYARLVGDPRVEAVEGESARPPLIRLRPLGEHDDA